ncbi:UNVERIFIED_CONTAM: hypothetical protein GTU68_021089 [Idotea baltica]|nr:hypothetical protein [Idotea baltica]
MAAETDSGAVVITSDPDVVGKATRIVLPGDGAFPHCHAQLGICVGMQMMAKRGFEYTETPGFGWIDGEIHKIAPTDATLPVPHMGWNDLVIDSPHPVLAGLKTGDHAYFVHSWQMQMGTPAQRLAHCDYAGDITAVVGRDTMIGTQFHPEKSQSAGLRMIANFLNWKP